MTTTTTPPNWIALARDAYGSSNSYFDASIRSQIEADLRQFQGQHPQGSKYLADSNRGRSRLFRPKTRAVIRKNEAAAAEAFFSNNDVVAITPQDDNNPAQMASAAVMQELLQYRLSKSLPWFQLLIGAYQDAQAVGVVASYQNWIYNPKKKIDRPDVRLIPIENLRFDPAADWTDPVNTSPYVIELLPMYVKDVKARMQRADPKTGEPKWHPLEESVIMQAARSYGDTIRQQREGQSRTDSKYQNQAVNSFNVVWVHKNIIEIDEVDYVYYTLGTEHLLSEPVPLEQAYFHGRRPYVVGCSVIETHKIYPSSLPRLTKDVQAEINEIANQRIDNVKFVLNKRYFAKRNKQVDLRSITRNVPGSVTLMQDTDDVKAVDFADVTASSYKEQEVLNLDFDDVAGSFSGSSVQSNRKLNETVGGMKMLNTNASQVSGYQLRTFVETWVEPVLRQLVLLEQYYETDDTVLRLCGDKAKIAEKFGVDAVTDDMLLHEFSLNVNVGLGATNPLDQLKQFIDGMTALRDILADGTLLQFGLNIEEVIKELFGKLGYKDGGRFFDIENQDPMVTHLQAVISDLQQQLSGKTDPKLVDAQVRKIDAEIAALGVRNTKDKALAVKTGVEAAYSAMQSAEVIAAVPQVAPIADEVMRAAGYQEPTPAGVDPNFPQPDIASAALGIDPVKDRRTGISYQPGAPTLDGQMSAPPTPGVGVRDGIQTQRPDGIGLANGGTITAYVNGGLVGDPFDDYSAPARGLDGLSDAERMGYRHHATRAPAASYPAAAQPAPGVTDHLLAQVDAAQDANTITGIQAGIYNEAIRTANPQYADVNRRASVGLTTNGFTDQTSADAALQKRLLGYADGGVITGPGTGTSDSIPAHVNGQPVAVSNGEYLIPANVVDAFGIDFFNHLVEQFHQPAPGTSAAPAPVPPLSLEDGQYVIPADVVQALGRDFFDRLLAHA